MSSSTNAAPAVRVAQVSKTFRTGKGAQVHALEDIDLEIAPGEFVSLIGPSGCGKSTLMRLIADLDSATSGTLEVFGKTARRARLDQDYGIAFQQAGLLPWRTVRANVELPLDLHGTERATRRARVDELLSLVGLSDFADKYPDQLSGGMQQRVAIARAFAEKPKLLLMDEPFGALDEMTRETMQTELARICAETGAAVVFVTHSIPEAVFLSDRVVVMSARPGRITTVLPMDLQGERTEDLREEATFFERVSAVREALHGAPHTGARGVENR
ncbi:ABC transporter ATP-binding protein [Microbacterium lacticum]|uniref:ABC transporter ATP-binding protein n=1 Tax=Microbacterium lacticum TaxID=33885 RepID=UPI00242D407C|nr:ABC transporter ATP-binding protein [Microbacterium lacticum]